MISESYNGTQEVPCACAWVCVWTGEDGHLVTYGRAPLDLPWGLFRDTSWEAAKGTLFHFTPWSCRVSSARWCLLHFETQGRRLTCCVRAAPLGPRRTGWGKQSLGREVPPPAAKFGLGRTASVRVSSVLFSKTSACDFSCMDAGGFSWLTKGSPSYSYGEGC